MSMAETCSCGTASVFRHRFKALSAVSVSEDSRVTRSLCNSFFLQHDCFFFASTLRPFHDFTPSPKMRRMRSIFDLRWSRQQARTKHVRNVHCKRVHVWYMQRCQCLAVGRPEPVMVVVAELWDERGRR